MCILSHRDYILYFRPNDDHSRCVCYYVRLEDLLACADLSTELQNWR